jgi:ABC-type lipoprotein export system ATPase subunit
MEFIELHNIYKTYYIGAIDVPVLKGVSLTVARGEMVALMGVSGSGKSTLMNILGCLDRPTSGEYWLEGRELSRLTADQRAMVRNRKLGFVFQNFNLLPRTSALENVAMPLTYTSDLSDREARHRAREMLVRVGLEDRLDQSPSFPAASSNGSPSPASEPSAAACDELTATRFAHQRGHPAMFTQLNEADGITIIMVTHEADVAKHARRIIHIHDGVIVNGEPMHNAETGCIDAGLGSGDNV